MSPCECVAHVGAFGRTALITRVLLLSSSSYGEKILSPSNELDARRGRQGSEPKLRLGDTGAHSQSLQLDPLLPQIGAAEMIRDGHVGQRRGRFPLLVGRLEPDCTGSGGNTELSMGQKGGE